MEPGIIHRLEMDRITSVGAYLRDQNGDEVLLPNRYLTSRMKVGSEVEVFVYMDSEDRPVATTEEPLLTRDQFGVLKVKEVMKYGAFLDWGLQKDLLLPFKEQLTRPQPSDWVPVYLKLDTRSGRLIATEKIKKHFSRDLSGLEAGQEVQLLIGKETELGTSVIVENQYEGLIYEDTIFEDYLIGDRTTGYISKIRNDGKLDILLQKPGYEAVSGHAETILNELKSNDGFLPYHDKSDPGEIQSVFQMSKKAFKKAVGQLYKEKVIRIEEEGIRLV